MASYRKATSGAPWLPDVPTQGIFDGLNAEMADLARRGGVSSWLFTLICTARALKQRSAKRD